MNRLIWCCTEVGDALQMRKELWAWQKYENNEKSAQRRRKQSKTLRAGCSKTEPKIFAPPQTDPFPGAPDGQNLISGRWSLPLPTNPVWRGSMHAISSYHGNRPTHTQIDRTDYNTLHHS